MIVALTALLALQQQALERGIPSTYHGVWDVSQAACDEDVSDMRLGVSSEEFSIYRDMFLVRHVRQKQDGSLILSVSFRSHEDFDNEGFGEPYELEWVLSDAGRQLTMSPGEGGTFWRRCASKSKHP